MNTRLAHLLRLAACLLMLAAAAAATTGRVFGHALSPTSAPLPNPTALFFRPVDLPTAAALLVLLLAAVVPLFAKSRRLRTLLLALDVAVLGLWSGLYLSIARLVGWSGASLPDDAAHSAAALLMLAMAFLYPLFGRPSHYCLHACPFGALQELASLLPLPKWRMPPPLVRALVFFRRALWALLMLALWLGLSSDWLSWEFFGAFAWRAVPPLVFALAVVFVALSAFVPRPYCRFVCPAGTLFKLAETNQTGASRPMKTSYLLNVLLAAALLLLCTRLHLLSAPPPADAPSAPPSDALVIDSTPLAPGVSGYAGPVPVEVEIRDGLVARVSPKLPNDETPAFFDRLEAAGFWQSWDGLPVAEAATARVDAVSSATYSSKAAIANVRAALASAAGLPAPEPAPAAAPPADRPHHAHHPHADNSPATEAALAAIRAASTDADPGDSEFGGATCAVTVLPPPSRSSMPLGDALSARATHRDFSPARLTDQELSDLLWAANGYNRPSEKKRTAPTAINRQEIDIYVCTATGAKKWVDGLNGNPDSIELQLITSDDLRGLTGRMNAGPDNFALAAPVTLVYVVDFKRQAMQDRPLDALKYAAVDCGFIGQNVYLHCAAAGLHTVYLGSLDAEKIAAALHLPPTSVPLFAQTVGHPADP